MRAPMLTAVGGAQVQARKVPGPKGARRFRAGTVQAGTIQAGTWNGDTFRLPLSDVSK